MRRVSSGIPGLDAMLRGGFPEGRMILVTGGPGTGKTIFCTQILHYGATQEGARSVFISLDETKEDFEEEMLNFGWDFRKLEQEDKFVFTDASGVRRIPEQPNAQMGGRELARIRLMSEIFKTFEKTRAYQSIDIDQATTVKRVFGDFLAERVVLDSISGLTFRFPEAWERRQAILDVMEALSEARATCFITSEVISRGEERQVQPEEYLSQGVIELQLLRTGERAIKILKMRGTEVDSVPRPYMINETGITVYPDQNVY